MKKTMAIIAAGMVGAFFLARALRRDTIEPVKTAPVSEDKLQQLQDHFKRLDTEVTVVLVA